MQSTTQKKLLLVRSYSTNKGGVASFYNNILPYFPTEQVCDLEIGKSQNTRNKFYPIWDQFRFRSTLKKVQPSLVHLNPSLGFKSFFRDGVFAWQAKQMGVPFLVFWHGWDKSFEEVVEKKYLAFFKKTFQHASGFIVLGSECERKLRDWGITVSIYRETTNVDESLLSCVNSDEKWSNASQLTEIKILFLARLERAKGVFETVQAIKQLLAKKIPVSLTIAGDGTIREKLEEYTRELGLSPEQVNFTGDIRGNEKKNAFTVHHIYCLPSHSEGLPTSVLEAMAFGMPVVTRPVGGLADIFADGKMGKLVQGKTPGEIAHCLEILISDKNELANIGKYNAEYAKEHFMASVVAKRILKVYEEVCCCKNL